MKQKILIVLVIMVLVIVVLTQKVSDLIGQIPEYTEVQLSVITPNLKPSLQYSEVYIDSFKVRLDNLLQETYVVPIIKLPASSHSNTVLNMYLVFDNEKYDIRFIGNLLIINEKYYLVIKSNIDYKSLINNDLN